MKQGKIERSPLPEEQGAAETTCDELTASPIPLCHSGGEGREIKSEVEPMKKGGVGGRHFMICVFFSLSYSDRPPGHTAGSCSAACPPTSQGHVLPGSFLATLSQACSVAWGYCDPSAGPSIWCC